MCLFPPAQPAVRHLGLTPGGKLPRALRSRGATAAAKRPVWRPRLPRLPRGAEAAFCRAAPVAPAAALGPWASRRRVAWAVKGGVAAVAEGAARLFSSGDSAPAAPVALAVDAPKDLLSAVVDPLEVLAGGIQDALLAVVEAAHAAGMSGVDFEGDPQTVTEAVMVRAAALNLEVAVWVSQLLPDHGDTAQHAQHWDDRGMTYFTSNLPPAVLDWMASTAGRRRTKVVGHRGASHSASENTLESVLLAFERGADGAEFDVQMSADGKIFLLHDDTLRRTSGREPCAQVPGGAWEADVLDTPVCDLSYEEVIRHVNVDFMGSGRKTPPLLSEVMATVPAGKFVFCEVKGGDLQTAEALCELALAEAWSPEQLFFIAFDLEVLRVLRRRLPGFRALHLADTRKAEEWEALAAPRKAEEWEPLAAPRKAEEWEALAGQHDGSMIAVVGA